MFIDLTIEACNVGSALAKPDTVLALTAKAHTIALKDIKAGTDVDKDAIQKKMLHSKPELSAELTAVITYAVKWAGDYPPTHMNSSLEYSKGLNNPNFTNLTKNLRLLNDVDMGKGLGGRHRRGCMKGGC